MTEVETVNQRAWTIPTPLSINRDGRVNFPLGTIVDMRLATLLTSDSTIVMGANDNFYLGTNMLILPNSIDGTSYRNFGAGNQDSTFTGAKLSYITGSTTCTLNGGTNVETTSSNGFIGSSGCTITNSDASNAMTNNGIINSDGCTLTKDGTGNYRRNTIVAGDSACFIRNSDSVACNGNVILGSASSSIAREVAATSGSFTRNNAIIAATSSTIVDQTDLQADYSTIVAASGSTFAKGTNRSAIIGCETVTGSRTRNCLIAGSQTSSLESTSTGVWIRGNMIGCVNCNSDLSGTSSMSAFMAECNSCAINNSATNGTIQSTSMMGCNSCTMSPSMTSASFFQNNTMLACQSCNVTPGNASSIQSGGLVSANATLGGGNARVAYIASNLANVSGSSNVIVGGDSPNVTSFSNVLAFGATATQSNQAIFGTRVDINGGPLAVTNGNVQSTQGYSGGVRSISTSSTLLATDNHVWINNTGTPITLTIPSAAAMSASFALNTTKRFVISCQDYFSICNMTCVSNLGTYGLLNYTFLRAFETVGLLFINDGSPRYVLERPYERESVCLAPLNSFGVAPPKSDAAQLPTSTSEATHLALTTTSYVTFTSVGVNYNPNSAILNAGFLQLTLRGEYKIDYEIQITTTSGGGSWLIRSDVTRTDTGATRPQSFQANMGLNTNGTRSIRGTTSWFWNDPTIVAPVTVRLSQDSGSLFNASAVITSVTARVQCRA